MCGWMMGKETILLKQNTKGKCKVKVCMLIFFFSPLKFFFSVFLISTFPIVSLQIYFFFLFALNVMDNSFQT